MLNDEHFDADEILRDVDESVDDGEGMFDDDMRELDFDNIHQENANFVEMAGDLDTAEDLWE